MSRVPIQVWTVLHWNLFYISFLLLFLALDVSLYLYIAAHFYTQKKQYYKKKIGIADAGQAELRVRS